MDALQEQFEQSVQLIKTKTSHTSNEDLLIIYGLYKQIMQGDCTTPQPWAVQLEQRARWDAWFLHSGMNKNEAMQKYIKKVNDIMQS